MQRSDQLELVGKAIANKRRIDILRYIDQHPGATVSDLSAMYGNLKITDYRTISQHTRKLDRAGMLFKYQIANSVQHFISPRGLEALSFLAKV